MSNDFKVKNCTNPQHLSMISDNLDKVVTMYNDDEITHERCYTMTRRVWTKKFKIEAYRENHTNVLVFDCIY